MSQDNVGPTISFQDLIQNYSNLAQSVNKMVKSLGSSASQVTPGKFLMIQFWLAQVSQTGDSISNMISQFNSMIANAIRNFKT